MRNNMFRRLPVEQATGRLYGGRHRLRVVYRTRDLVVLGLGVMIGSGIFKIAGSQATTSAGPAVIISFVIAGVVCMLAALAYAELSSIIPVAGSAYSFSYVAFGEVWAWVVGWSLILELLLAASVVARGWSLFTAQMLSDFNVKVPESVAGIIGQPKGFDIFALSILVLIIIMLATGSKVSLRSLWFMVLAKLIVIGLVIATGLKFFDMGNLKPFVPPAQAASGTEGRTVLDAIMGAFTGSSPQVFGVWGIFAAAPAIAFAYIGFDLIATASEETDDAPRKVPRGMLASLGIAIVLYIGVAVAMLGMASYKNLDPAQPAITNAFAMVGADSMRKVIDVGVVIALTTVILVVMVSLTRVVFSMARDGLLPRPIAQMSRYKVPSRATLVAGAAAVIMSQTIDVLTLEQMVVIGTLFAFLFVSAAVLALRKDRPDLHRPFRVPVAPFTAIVTILATGWLMLNLKVQTWGYFLIWMLAGVLIYLAYGRRRSQMRLLLSEPAPPRRTPGQMAPPPSASQPMTAPIGGDPSSTGAFRRDPYLLNRSPNTELPPGYHPSGGRQTGQYPAHHSGATPVPGQRGPGDSGPFRPRPFDSGPHQNDPYQSGPQPPYPPGQPPRQTGPQPSQTGQYPSDPRQTGQYPSDPRQSGPWPGEEPEPPVPPGRHRR
ncbi:amino acid permease [Spirillospora sp. CA-294931]|uniref:APC family permease n=1 Tax=Spirillospora sp. CA-294931 TaxID=3240042 RepID=UPI003D8EF791